MNAEGLVFIFRAAEMHVCTPGKWNAAPENSKWKRKQYLKSWAAWSALTSHIDLLQGTALKSYLIKFSGS